MEFLTFLFTAIYIVLGFGVQRMAKKIDSSQGRELGNTLITLFIWPLFLALQALNEDFF